MPNIETIILCLRKLHLIWQKKLALRNHPDQKLKTSPAADAGHQLSSNKTSDVSSLTFSALTRPSVAKSTG